MNEKKIDKKKLKEVMSYLGRQSVDARHKGLNKKEISEMYSNISKQNAKSNKKRTGGEVL